MTTTPDSRIRADWHLDALPGPESTSLPPGVPTRAQAGHLVEQMTPELRAEMEAHWARHEPIDTSTTAGRIAVMQAWVRDWRSVECIDKQKLGDKWEPVQDESPEMIGEPAWNWDRYDYRIAPPPAPRSALQAARECRSGMTTVDVTSAAGRLCSLLSEIDYSPVVEVLERRISWDAADLSALPKGRYRLLRDDA